MTPAARLQSAIEILELVAQDRHPADMLAGAYFRARRYIGAKDRAAIADAAYGVMRHRARLGWWCAHYRAAVTARSLALAWLYLVEARKQEEVSALFSAGKFAPAPLNGEEEKFLRRLKGHDLLHPAMPVFVRYEIPEWIAPRLARYGARLEKELAALLDTAPVDLRVNIVKSTRDAAMEELRAAGLNPALCLYAPLGIRLSARAGLPSLPVFREGRIEVQDEGSQLAAMLVDAREGMRVADFCAGAGGKTLALAAAMANKGRITALDVSATRLRRAEQRFRRAGLHNIQTQPLKGEGAAWIKRQKGKFDRVLVDAPCSGTGTWRRNPDARWKFLPENLTALLALQQKILADAARLVKSGGRLIYATCSLLEEENQQQVAVFLAAQPDFALLPLPEVWRDVSAAPPPCSGDYLELTPARHGTDGFFTAVMMRKMAG